MHPRWITIVHQQSAYELRCLDIRSPRTPDSSAVHIFGADIELLLTGTAASAFWQESIHALRSGVCTIRLNPDPKEMTVRIFHQEERNQQKVTANDANPNHLYLRVSKPAART